VSQHIIALPGIITIINEISCYALGSKVLKFPHRWAGLLSDKWCAEPRSEPDSGHPTVRDRRAALRNVVSHAYGDLVRASISSPTTACTV
jgi:hypothetical protein